MIVAESVRPIVARTIETDWQRMIEAIRRAYFESECRELTDYKLGLMVGADAKTIMRIRTGKNRDPRESVANRIRAHFQKIAIVQRETLTREA